MSKNDRGLIRNLQQIGQTLARLERRVAAVERAPQMRHTSWTGKQAVYDEAGNIRQVVGIQNDGTYTITEQNAPPPPQPSMPIVEAVPGGIKIAWDGSFVDGVPRPADMWYVEVHVGDTLGYQKVDATQVHAFGSTRGGDYTYMVGAEAGTRYISLVAVNNSKAESLPTADLGATALPIAATSDGLPPGKVAGVDAESGIKSIFLSWDVLENADLVTYNIYAGDTPGFAIDQAHFQGNVVGTRFTIFQVRSTATNAMTNLVASTPYYFRVVATDEDGAGTASDEVTGTSIQVDTPDIAPYAVTGGKVEDFALAVTKFNTLRHTIY